MIETRAVPCWHILNQHGQQHDVGDYAPHFDSEEDAAEEAAELSALYEADGYTYHADRFAELPCVTVKCDGCGYQFDTEGTVLTHYQSAEAARLEVGSCDWTFGAQVLCCECSAAQMGGAS